MLGDVERIAVLTRAVRTAARTSVGLVAIACTVSEMAIASLRSVGSGVSSTTLLEAV